MLVTRFKSTNDQAFKLWSSEETACHLVTSHACSEAAAYFEIWALLQPQQATLCQVPSRDRALAVSTSNFTKSRVDFEVCIPAVTALVIHEEVRFALASG